MADHQRVATRPMIGKRRDGGPRRNNCVPFPAEGCSSPGYIPGECRTRAQSRMLVGALSPGPRVNS